MIPLLTAEEMRRLDGHAIDTVGIPGVCLMETAGRGVLESLWQSYRAPASRGTVVVCGRGNNGGDGFVVARALLTRGVPIWAVLLGPRSDVRGDARVHLEAYAGAGGEVLEVTGAEDEAQADAMVRRAALVIDAILGTGLREEVRGLAARAIGWIQAQDAPVVSVDIPSGISSDTGAVCGVAVTADLTVTFAHAKRGHLLYPGREHAGRLVVVDIGIPHEALNLVGPGLWRLEPKDFEDVLVRALASHKGLFGHLLVFAGGLGKVGAAGLAAWGALRSGAGLVTVASPSGLGAESRLPLEVMTWSLGGDAGPTEWHGQMWEEVAGSPVRYDAIVVGPGMGTGRGAREALAALLSVEGRAAVLDADALNLLGAHPEIWRERRREVVLTPHPGEAARLLRSGGTAEIQADRVAAARRLADTFGCVVILKGAGTLVASPEKDVFLVAEGNPGMATAGSGDVLSGIVGALLARGLSPLLAAQAAAFLHALAGDFAAARRGREGMVATDVVDALPEAVAQISRPTG